MNTSTIIHTLWSATAAGKLSDEQLNKLSCNDSLVTKQSDVADVMMGIGCFVSDDVNNGGKTGSFQEPDSIAQLLWFLSDVIDTAAAASFVANDARTLLHHRELNRKRPSKQAKGGE